ncbi:MAG: MBL fold metallo-hydrolase [Alphaproteobacteria bacterium]|nr:MBL fold metallo-hydrolase [Alphaproteobacteria bacterium]
MDRVIILGSGAATGVPVVAKGWENCNPNNPKNVRRRSGTLVEINDTKIQIDTSQDFRCQMLDNAITELDAVLYTHVHADHVSGIDDLRALTQYNNKSLNVYAIKEHIDEIKKRFGYVFTDVKLKEITLRPQLVENIIEYGKSFKVNNVEVMPIALAGHTVATSGYVFNAGKLVVISDYKQIPEQSLEYLQKIDVNVMIMPLTQLGEQIYHENMEINKKYIDIIKPARVIFTHMGGQCDYDEIAEISPKCAVPAYDNMIVEI